MVTPTPADLSKGPYPVTYSVPFWKGILRVSAYFGLFLLALVGRAQILRSGFRWWLVITILLLTVLLLVVVANNVFARVKLYPERIERITWFGKRILRRNEISGIRRGGWGPFKNAILISRTDHFRSILLPHSVQRDAAWDAWMAEFQ
jgi:hypothetical protein